mgnify:FL=1|tara:strand:+ start:140 stop:355 length:216 start_codon:yes stop_codon:yes gene_type:complete
MQIQKKIEDITFTPMTVFGEEMEVSENIVMASAAGWYVGAICKEGGFIQPYDRYTDYFATPEEAAKLLEVV